MDDQSLENFYFIADIKLVLLLSEGTGECPHESLPENVPN